MKSKIESVKIGSEDKKNEKKSKTWPKVIIGSVVAGGSKSIFDEAIANLKELFMP